MPIGSSETTTRRSVWLTEATVAVVREQAQGRGLTISRQLEELALRGLAADREITIGSQMLAGVRLALDQHFFTGRKLATVAARQASLAARLVEQIVEILIFERVLTHPDTVEQDVLRQGEGREALGARRLVETIVASADVRGLKALRSSLVPLGLGEETRAPMSARAAASGTKQRAVWLTAAGLDAIATFADDTGQRHFSAALETLVRLGLGETATTAFGPLVVASTRQAAEQYFMRFRKVLAVAAREAGIAAALAEDALGLQVLAGAEDPALGITTMRAVVSDATPTKAAGRRVRALRERLSNGAVKQSTVAMRAKLSQTLARLPAKAQQADYIEEPH